MTTGEHAAQAGQGHELPNRDVHDPARHALRQDWSRFDALLEAPIAESRLSGAVVLAWHRGQPVHAGTFGWQDVATRTPMARDTLFRLYSMTKPVTAAAMMLLWQQGLWRPEDPVARFLPELADRRLASGEIGAQPTMEQLMSHQAGFAYGLADAAADRALVAADVPAFPHQIDAAAYLARLSAVPLAYAPGEGWRYSIAMDLQGIIIERLSGMPLAEFMRTRLFEPLGMSDTGFAIADDKASRLATLYMPAGNALFAVPTSPIAPDATLAPIMASGGAGLISTADDYLRFARMLHEGGALDGVRVLSEEATAMLRRSHTPPALLDGGFGTAPHWLRPGYEYAYNGVVVTDPAAADVSLGHGTYFWDGAAGCWFWSDPENDVVLVCMVPLLAEAELLGLQFASRDIVAAIVGGRAREDR